MTHLESKGYQIKESNESGYIILEQDKDGGYELAQLVEGSFMLERGTDIYTDHTFTAINSEGKSQDYLVVLSLNESLNKIEVTSDSCKEETRVVSSPSLTIVEVNSSIEYHFFDDKGN